MSDRVANPRALGFSVFAILAWMYSMPDAGWYGMGAMGTSTSSQVATLAAIGMLIAGIAGFMRNDAWHGTFFIFWAALIWGMRGGMGSGAASIPGFDAWAELTVALVSFFLYTSAQRSGAGMAAMLTALGICLTFLTMAIGHWTGTSLWTVIDGYIGLITGLLAFWAAWNEFSAMGGGGQPA